MVHPVCALILDLARPTMLDVRPKGVSAGGLPVACQLVPQADLSRAVQVHMVRVSSRRAAPAARVGTPRVTGRSELLLMKCLVLSKLLGLDSGPFSGGEHRLCPLCGTAAARATDVAATTAPAVTPANSAVW